MNSAAPSSSKEELRRSLRERRTLLPAQERQAAATSLAEHVLTWLAEAEPDGAGGLVAAYLSAPPEPGTDELLARLIDAGYDVVVPVCEPQYQLSWVHWLPGVELAKSPRAPLLEPTGPRHHFTALEPFRLVLVPGLGMDVRGNRIGQGGGYYDRFLAQLASEQPGTCALGYLYDEEILDTGSFAVTVLDMPIQGAFTPSGLQQAS